MAKRKRIYISGQITGADLTVQISRSGFLQAWLVARRWLVYNPFASCTHDACHIITHEEWIDHDKEWIRLCDALVMLPGWESSIGVNMELEFAQGLKLDIYTWQNDLMPYTGKPQGGEA